MTVNEESGLTQVKQGNLWGERRSQHANDPLPGFSCTSKLERSNRFTAIAEEP